MLLKIIIVILFIAILISLSCGYLFFVKDQGDKNSMRLMRALGTRVTLAGLLLSAIVYGVYSGQLGSSAPWDKQLHPERLKKPLPEQETP